MEEEQINRLIIRYLSHETSSEEEEELLEWVSKDISNQRIFNDWVELWSSRPNEDTSFNLSDGLKKLRNRVDAVEKESRYFTWRKVAAVAAVLITALSAVLIVANYSFHQSEGSYIEHKTRPGEKLEVTLPDGSVVLVNANSILKYPRKFEQETREVYLTGEAFFNVTRNPQQPFVIHSGPIETKVLGTSFNIHNRGDSAVVSVATGKVQVSHDQNSEIALPMEKVVYKDVNERLIKGVSSPDLELAWKDNTLIFKDSRLTLVAEKLHETYGYTFSFENENVTKCFITGRFKNQSLDAVLKAISFSTGTQARVVGKSVTFFGPGCE